MANNNTEFSLTFAKRLYQTRKNQKLTQKDVADMTGIPTGTISSYEMFDGDKGKRPSLANAVLIAKALNVSVDFLCGLEFGNTELTVTDIVRQIVKIDESGSTILIDEWDLSESIIKKIAPNISDNSKSDGKIGVIAFQDDRINNFLIDWGRMKQLYIKGTVNKEFYHKWLDEQYKIIAEQEEEK